PEPKSSDVPVVLVESVTPDYFPAMQTPLVRGRFFSRSDRKGTPLVAIVDAWTAKRYWPGTDAVGKFLKLGRTQPVRQIVGVVGSMDRGVLVRLLKGQIGQVYLPFAQEPKAAMSFAMRTAGDPAAVAAVAQKMMQDIDLDQPVFEVKDLEAA